MDWETLYCPNPFCRSYGRPFRQGLLVKNRTTRGQKQAFCRSGGRSIAVNYGTAYFELDNDPVIFETMSSALAEGVSLLTTIHDPTCGAPRGAGRYYPNGMSRKEVQTIP